MHAKIRKHNKQHDLRFFLQTGQLDEIADRNKNGIIDSIDDTLGIIEELVKVGYSRADQITYLELEDGKHDIETWARVMPLYLKWLSK
jgi:predicted alpha/beta-hydrolase family hydrolase